MTQAPLTAGGACAPAGLHTLPLSAITADPTIQQRAAMDPDLVAEYAETLSAWIAAAPVVVFQDDAGILLADGFHRLAAARTAGLEAIPAIVKTGDRRDALRFACGANARNGSRPRPGDLERAYQTAVREGFADPADTASVASVLQCSERHARRLTESAREQARSARDAEIARLADEGKPQRAIADAVGVSLGYVNTAVQKRTMAENEQPELDPIPADLKTEDQADLIEPENVENFRQYEGQKSEQVAAIEPPSAATVAATMLACLPEAAKRQVIGGVAPEAARAVTAVIRRDREEQKRIERAAAYPPAPLEQDATRIIVRDIRHLTADDIPTESVDVIVTDPPYPAEYIDLFDTLGELAARVLKPGGSLIVMTGQSHLIEYLNRLARFLTYRWTAAYHIPGATPRIWPATVNNQWKPLLWFTNGPRADHWTVNDFIQTPQAERDKSHHHWGQSEHGTAALVERFSQPGMTILDPFLGGGTTGVVCKRLGRRFIGVERSSDDAARAAARIAHAAPPLPAPEGLTM